MWFDGLSDKYVSAKFFITSADSFTRACCWSLHFLQHSLPTAPFPPSVSQVQVG